MRSCDQSSIKFLNERPNHVLACMLVSDAFEFFPSWEPQLETCSQNFRYLDGPSDIFTGALFVMSCLVWIGFIRQVGSIHFPLLGWAVL